MAGFHCIKFKVSKYENEIEILKKNQPSKLLKGKADLLCGKG